MADSKEKEVPTEGTQYEIWVHLFATGSTEAIDAVTISATTHVAALRLAILDKWKNKLQARDASELVVRPTRGGAPLAPDTDLWEVPFELNKKGKRQAYVYVEVPSKAAAAPDWGHCMDLPLPDAKQSSAGDCVTTTKAQLPDRHYPEVLKRWHSFTEKALQFQAPPGNPNFRDLVKSNNHLTSEPQVWTMLEVNIGDYFSDSPVGEIVQRGRSVTKKVAKGDEKVATMCIGEPDFVAKNNKGSITGVIEAKVPWGVDLLDHEGSDMTFVARYNNTKISDVKREYTWSAVAQIVGYMVDNHIRYGLLTTYNQNRFFCAHSANEIEVSDVVLAHSATGPGVVSLRRAFAFWLSLCNGPNAKLPRLLQKRDTDDLEQEKTHLADEITPKKALVLDGQGFLQASTASAISHLSSW